MIISLTIVIIFAEIFIDITFVALVIGMIIIHIFVIITIGMNDIMIIVIVITFVALIGCSTFLFFLHSSIFYLSHLCCIDRLGHNEASS